MGKESARYPQLEMLLHFTSFWSCIGIALHDLGPFFCDWPFNIFQQRTMRLLNLLLPPHIYLLTVKMNTNKQPEGHEWFSNFFPTSNIHIGINDQHVVQRVTRTEVTKKKPFKIKITYTVWALGYLRTQQYLTGLQCIAIVVILIRISKQRSIVLVNATNVNFDNKFWFCFSPFFD